MIITDLENREYVLVIKEFSGPSSYTTGGFQVTVDNLAKIDDAIVVLNSGDNFYKVEASASGRTITVKVFELYYDSGNTVLAKKEVDDGTDLSDIKFKAIIIGE